MPAPAVCGLAFRSSEGGTVRLHDAICWRHLQGRSCLSIAQHELGSATDVAVVPIPPPVAALEQPLRDCTPTASAAADAASQQIKRVLSAAASALRAAGLRAAVDDDPKHTPGAKFHRWEQLGVQLRVDVGQREARGHCCSLSIAEQLHAAAGTPPTMPPACTLRPAKGRVVLQTVPIDLLGQVCRWYVDNGGSSSTSQQPCTKLHLFPGQVVCHQNLRHLVGLGGRCQCGGPHKSLAELKDEAASAFHNRTGLHVAAWLNVGAGGEQEDGGGPQHVALFVGGLPQERRLDEVKAGLWAALQPHGVARVKVGKGHMGLSRGWGYAYFPSEDAAARLLEATGGVLEVLGHSARCSRPTGRADTLFPALPAATRARLRIDSVAAFSVTDQYTADLITSLVACLASATLLSPAAPPTTAAPSTPAAPSGGAQATRTASIDLQLPPVTTTTPSTEHPPGLAAGVHSTSHSPPIPPSAPPQPPPPPPPPPLLPLTITDGTACSGGNTISFAARFARVHAVELDPDRAADLVHNLSLLSLVGRAACSSPSPPSAATPSSTGGCLSAGLAPPGVPCTSSSSTPSCNSHATLSEADAPASSSSSSSATAKPAAVSAPLDSQPCGLSPAPGTGRPPAWGTVEVHNRDYTLFWGQLRQDVVFLDPPWGGPQYRQGGPLPDLPLGATTLVALVACLAGACRLCCVRLPKSMDLLGFVGAVLAALGGCGGRQGRTAVVGVVPFGACKVLSFSFCDAGEQEGTRLAVHEALRGWWAGPGKCHRPWFYDPAAGTFCRLDKREGGRRAAAV